MHKIIGLIFFIVFLKALAQDPFTLPEPPKHQSQVIVIHYANAQTIARLIRQKTSGLLSSTGHLITDTKNNQLWVNDTPQQLHQIRNFIALLDKPDRQILIKAKIIVIDDVAKKELGVYFSLLQNKNQAQFDLPLIKINNQQLLSLKINALAEKGHALILSSPQIVTNNRHNAVIESGEQIPYQEKGRYGNTNLTFKKAVLSLEVTPTLLPNNKISLSLLIYQDKPNNVFINGEPTISTEKLKTKVTLSAKHTLILGGIHEQNSSINKTEIPFLSKIPLIGALFTNKQRNNQHKQLLIMITPSILPE